ncbi:hypothetical protein Syun_017420 [Stephania yunnanensis]|uniref:Uncharacterized protein n=1 Tax=Stephania yunnanensis TaxID=152371 RepID=A0AAP0J703_9MAGN
MARFGVCAVLAFSVVFIASSIVASIAQDDGGIAPSPTMDAGVAGFALVESGVLICAALLFSLISLLWQ